MVIENALENYLGALKGPPALLKAMAYAVFGGGKRLRPLLTLESARVLNYSIKKALPFACAIEFIHNCSLVHDDLPSMDDDDIRRGKPTCHRKFGEAVAILAGDALLNLAFGILAEVKHKRTAEITRRISEAVGTAGIIGGQVLDLEKANRLPRRRPKHNSACAAKRDLSGLAGRLRQRRIDAMKTASLIAVSCEVGALAAGGNGRDVKRMREFGQSIGLAFQIADDIEDLPPDKNTFFQLKGEIDSLIADGKRYLEVFGKKADGLKGIADKIQQKASLHILAYGKELADDAKTIRTH